MTKKEKSSDKGQNESGPRELMSCTSSDKFNAERESENRDVCTKRMKKG